MAMRYANKINGGHMIFSAKVAPIPANGLLEKYSGVPGCHTDCYFVDIPKVVSFPDCVKGFLTSFVFRFERAFLSVAISSPTTDQDIEKLSCGRRDTLAWWRVEAREANQLIMEVKGKPIRTWLMAESSPLDDTCTRLYFGSAVLPTAQTSTGTPTMEPAYRRFLWFHTLYSYILLGSAKRKLR